MFYVYLLQSQNNNDIYIGFSENLKQRVIQHNTGRVPSTKPNRPWKLVYYEAYSNKSDARKRELNLKQHKPKSDLIERINDSLHS